MGVFVVLAGVSGIVAFFGLLGFILSIIESKPKDAVYPFVIMINGISLAALFYTLSIQQAMGVAISVAFVLVILAISSPVFRKILDDSPLEKRKREEE